MKTKKRDKLYLGQPDALKIVQVLTKRFPDVEEKMDSRPGKTSGKYAIEVAKDRFVVIEPEDTLADEIVAKVICKAKEGDFDAIKWLECKKLVAFGDGGPNS